MRNQLACACLVLLSCSAAISQKRPIDKEWARQEAASQAMNNNPSLQAAPRAPDVAELKREVDELVRLSQSLPPAIDAASKGILQRDLNERLKRIEKLSKRLRGQLSPPLN